MFKTIVNIRLTSFYVCIVLISNIDGFQAQSGEQDDPVLDTPLSRLHRKLGLLYAKRNHRMTSYDNQHNLDGNLTSNQQELESPRFSKLINNINGRYDKSTDNKRAITGRVDISSERSKPTTKRFVSKDFFAVMNTPNKLRQHNEQNVTTVGSDEQNLVQSSLARHQKQRKSMLQLVKARIRRKYPELNKKKSRHFPPIRAFDNRKSPNNKRVLKSSSNRKHIQRYKSLPTKSMLFPYNAANTIVNPTSGKRLTRTLDVSKDRRPKQSSRSRLSRWFPQLNQYLPGVKRTWNAIRQKLSVIPEPLQRLWQRISGGRQSRHIRRRDEHSLDAIVQGAALAQMTSHLQQRGPYPSSPISAILPSNVDDGARSASPEDGGREPRLGELSSGSQRRLLAASHQELESIAAGLLRRPQVTHTLLGQEPWYGVRSVHSQSPSPAVTTSRLLAQYARHRNATAEDGDGWRRKAQLASQAAAQALTSARGGPMVRRTRSDLSSSYTYSQLQDILSKVGAEYILSERGVSGSDKQAHAQQSGSVKLVEDCQCEDFSKPGTVLGVLSLAALLIYALTASTLSYSNTVSATANATGRALAGQWSPGGQQLQQQQQLEEGLHSNWLQLLDTHTDNQPVNYLSKNHLTPTNVSELVASFLEASQIGALSTVFDSAVFENTMQALQMIIASYAGDSIQRMKRSETATNDVLSGSMHLRSNTTNRFARQSDISSVSPVVVGRSLRQTGSGIHFPVPLYTTGLNHEIFSRKGVQRRQGAVPKYIDFLKRANRAEERSHVSSSLSSFDNNDGNYLRRRAKKYDSLGGAKSVVHRDIDQIAAPSQLNKRKLWKMTLRALRKTKKPKPWLQQLDSLIDKMRKKIATKKRSTTNNSPYALHMHNKQPMKYNECECPTRKGLEQLLGFIPIAVIVGYTTTVSASAAVAGTAATGSSSSGSDSTTTVTVNGGNTVTSTNTNSPTITNTDNDVITTSAQANPINTLTNTASNQDNDIITNMASGRSGSAAFGLSTGPVASRAVQSVTKLFDEMSSKQPHKQHRHRRNSDATQLRRNQDPLLGLLYDILRLKDTAGGDSCFHRQLCAAVVKAGINKSVLSAASIPIALLVRSHRGGTVSTYQQVMLNASSDRCALYKCPDM